MKYEHDIELNHDEIRKIISPEIAYAGPLGPCTAIAIYDGKSRSGYIAFSYPGVVDLIKKTIDTAVADFKDISKLKVAVAGANISDFSYGGDEGPAELSARNWQDLENLIGSYAFVKGNIKMHKEKFRGKNQHMYLDCERGKIIVQSEDEKAMHDDYT